MGTIRIPKERSFFSVSNALAQDKTLSFEAVGMLAYLLSKPDDWQMRTFDIEARGNIGKTARRSIMKETERAGYITFHTGRNKEGQLESWYQLHEQPVPEDQRTQSWETGKAKQPGAGFPPPVDLTAGEPAAGQASAGQPVPLVNTEVQTTDLQKREKNPPAPQPTNPLSHPLGIALLTSAGFSEFQRESLSPMNYSKLQAAVTRLSKASISDQHIIQARRDWWGKSNPNFDQLADLALQAAANVKSNPKPPTHRPYVVEDWQRNFPRE